MHQLQRKLHPAADRQRERPTQREEQKSHRNRPVTIFLAVSVAFLLLSLGGPLTLPISGGMQFAQGLKQGGVIG